MATPAQNLPRKTLTIIAKAPNPKDIADTKDRSGILRLKQSIKSTPASAIDDLVRKVKIHERASSVTDIDDILEHRHPAATSVVQIVGHAYPGRLSLGHFWTGRYFDSLYYYALDSNPGSYGLLKRNLRSGQTLRLLGCAVGADAPGFVNNGTTFLFALKQLLEPRGIKVEASIKNINPTDFEDDGTFIALQKLAGYAGSQAAPEKPRPRAPTFEANAVAPADALAAAESSTTVRFLGRNQIEITGTVEEVETSHPPLALPLYTTTARLGAQTTRLHADLLRVEDDYQLRIRLPDGARYYTLDARAENELVQLARENEYAQSRLNQFHDIICRRVLLAPQQN
jgi:Domain of unknown function (DUF4347)